MSNTATTSLSKALRLLRLMGVTNNWMGVRELARLAGYTPSSVHGLLKDLLAQGFAEFDLERRQYRLGLAILTLAEGMDAQDSLGSFARPWVRRLSEELDETVMALCLRGSRALVVACVESRRDLRAGGRERVVERPHLWASGQVLVAALPDAERQHYAAQASSDPASAALMLSQLEQVRTQGWAEAVDVEASGIVACGAPVLDPGGRCVMALGTSAPIGRTPAERRVCMRERLLATTAAMGAALGTA